MSSTDNTFSFGPISEEYADVTQRNLPKLTLAQQAELDSASRGVNPYDRDATQQPASKTQRTDLRKLSEWIKLQKQIEAEKAAAGEATAGSALPPGVPNP